MSPPLLGCQALDGHLLQQARRNGGIALRCVEWKITHGKVLQEQVSALLDQAIERAFAFAPNDAWLPSVDVFFVISGPTTYIGHILVKRGDRNDSSPPSSSSMI
jgi:hypothetical protein